MIRKKVRAKRGAASTKMKPPLDGRITNSFDTWSKLLDPANEQDLLRRLDRFEHLRTMFLEDQAANTFIELGFANLLFQRVKFDANVDALANNLFTISDLVDVDDTGTLGEYFYKHGLLDIVLTIWRTDPLGNCSDLAISEDSTSSSDSTVTDDSESEKSTTESSKAANDSTKGPFVNKEISRLKAACLCVLSGLVLFDFKSQQGQSHSSGEVRISHLLDQDLDSMNFVLQCKGYTALHARCINFANNLYVHGQCKDFISNVLLPSILALLMYNVSNHIKLRKKKLMQHPVVSDAMPSSLGSNSPSEGDYEAAASHGQQKKQKAQETAASSSNEPHEILSVLPSVALTDSTGDLHADSLAATGTSPVVDADNVDPYYDDTTYHEFLSSACLFLSNVTARVDNCKVAELFSVTEIMTLLFHHSTDHSLDALISVIKCLANLANLSDNRMKLIESNILPMAAKLVHLNMEHAEELKANLVLLLANLSGFEASNRLLIEAGVVFPIADLIAKTQNTPYRAYGCLALANLCLESTAVPQVMRSHASLKKLLELCYNSNPFVRRQVARVIYAIASYPAGTYIPDLRQLGADASLRYIITMSNKQTEAIAPPQSAEFLATTALSVMQSYTHAAMSNPAAPNINHAPQTPSIPPSTAVPKSTAGASGTAATNSPVATPGQPTTGANNTPASTNGPTTAPRSASVPTAPHAIPVSNKTNKGRAPNPTRSQEEKERGNEFFRKKKYKESIICYTRAAEFNPDDATLFSNRSAAYLHLEHYELALRDAERCIEMTPGWVKGYFRKGKALLGQEKFEEAIDAFKAASEIDPGNKEIQDALRITQLRMKNKNNPVINHPLTARLNAFVSGIPNFRSMLLVALMHSLIFRLISPMPSSSATSK